jgi:hypothetical protein
VEPTRIELATFWSQTIDFISDGLAGPARNLLHIKTLRRHEFRQALTQLAEKEPLGTQ